jgi:3-hydroxyisobutyrate dehydrogenase
MGSESSLPRVALSGLGLMGAGMAANLLRAGYPLTLYNRSREKASPFLEQGARVADTPRESAADADVILSMVADDAASRGVWLGEDGALAGAPGGALCIESSTLSVGWVRELGAAAAERGPDFLDAPVTGSRTQAAAGELLFLVGGSATALQRATPVLTAMGRGVVHVGAAGSGALLKLVNNFLCGVQAASLAEALALVLHLMAKDLRYVGAAADRNGLTMSSAAAALGEHDLSAVVEQFRR